MSALREQIIKEIRYYDETDSYSALADAVLAVVIAHMAVSVTDEDAVEMWHVLDRAHGIPAHDAMKAALEAFVANKMKAETTP